MRAARPPRATRATKDQPRSDAPSLVYGRRARHLLSRAAMRIFPSHRLQRSRSDRCSQRARRARQKTRRATRSTIDVSRSDARIQTDRRLRRSRSDRCAQRDSRARRAGHVISHAAMHHPLFTRGALDTSDLAQRCAFPGRPFRRLRRSRSDRCAQRDPPRATRRTCDQPRSDASSTVCAPRA